MSLLDQDERYDDAAENTQLSDATQAVTTSEPKPSLFKQLLGGSTSERLYNLNWSIAAYPDVAANYVLRGELLLQHNDLVQAIADFRRALEISARQFEIDDWGIVAQAMQDRALAGLRDALRRVARYNRHANQTGQ
ncbi:MAG TPA: hypothetical protein VHD90_09235 [Phototrophicaceae bacterium]|nr:hypothetical protein [Phototrophicaceae bacterium]